MKKYCVSVLEKLGSFDYTIKTLKALEERYCRIFRMFVNSETPGLTVTIALTVTVALTSTITGCHPSDSLFYVYN